jgi:hypothetical protein
MGGTAFLLAVHNDLESKLNAKRLSKSKTLLKLIQIYDSKMMIRIEFRVP